MGPLVQVRLGHFRPVQFFHLNNVACNRGDIIILQVDRGQEHGEVVSNVDAVCAQKSESAVGTVLRAVTDEDKAVIEANKKKAEEAMTVCIRKIRERKLDMQI